MRKSKTIILILAILIHNQFHAFSPSQETNKTANTLIKASYTSSEMQGDVMSFINDNDDINRMNTRFIIPSIDEIIKKVSQLQGPQGSIEDSATRKQAIKALKTAIKATRNAISIVELQAIRINENDYHIPSTKNDTLLEILRSKINLLQQKLDQLDQKPIWSYFAKPSTAYLVFGTAIIVAITGAAYFHHFTYKEPYDHSSYTFNSREGEAHISTQVRKTLTDFVDPHNNINGKTHYNDAKKLLQNLKKSEETTINAVATPKVVEMIETFIEGYEKRDVVAPKLKDISFDFFMNTEKSIEKLPPSNFRFWGNIYYKKTDSYRAMISEITGIEQKDINLVNTIYYKLGVNIKP